MRAAAEAQSTASTSMLLPSVSATSRPPATRLTLVDVGFKAQVHAGLADFLGRVGADVAVEAAQEQRAAVQLGHLRSPGR
jgi:hypothetical protein